MRNWGDYYASVGERPNSMLVRTLDRFAAKISKGAALDLGAGNLRDSKYLLKCGFESVTAVDREPPLADVPAGITRITMPLEQYVPEPHVFDLACCFHTLYFFPEEQVAAIVARAYEALAAGGLLLCNLLTDKDDWASKPGRWGFSEQQLLSILATIPNKQIRRDTGTRKSTDGNERHGDSWIVLVQKRAAQ